MQVEIVKKHKIIPRPLQVGVKKPALGGLLSVVFLRKDGGTLEDPANDANIGGIYLLVFVLVTVE